MKILKVLYHSLRNIRKVHVDPNNKRLVNIAASMKRTSYLAELEMYYCYALHSK